MLIPSALGTRAGLEGHVTSEKEQPGTEAFLRGLPPWMHRLETPVFDAYRTLAHRREGRVVTVGIAARRLGVELPSGHEYTRTCDPFRLPLPGRHAHMVYHRWGLSRLPETQVRRALVEWTRVLAVEGVLVLSLLDDAYHTVTASAHRIRALACQVAPLEAVYFARVPNRHSYHLALTRRRALPAPDGRRIRLGVIPPTIGLGDNVATASIVARAREACLQNGWTPEICFHPIDDLSAEVARLYPWIDHIAETDPEFRWTPDTLDEADVCWALGGGGECLRKDSWVDSGIRWAPDLLMEEGIPRYFLSTWVANLDLGIPVEIAEPARPVVPDAPLAWARRLLAPYRATTRLLVAMSRRDIVFKSWPAEHYCTLVKLLIEQLGATVVGVGLKAEQIPYQGPGFLNLAGQLSFPQFAAVLSQCDGFFGVDSGPGHLATAFGLRSVVLCTPAFKRKHWRILPTGRAVTVLYPGVACDRPCEPCEDTCLRTILPDIAFEAMRDRLALDEPYTLWRV
jgi:hypothetical protein